MKILGNAIYQSAKTKPFQKALSLISKPESEKFLNTAIPIGETLYAKTFYCLMVSKNKNIPEERKSPLIIQSAVSGIIGMIASVSLLGKIKPFKDKILQNIEKSTLKNKKNIINGVNILMPLGVSTLIARYAVPALSVPFSCKLNKMFNKKSDNIDKGFNTSYNIFRDKMKKLDINI